MTTREVYFKTLIEIEKPIGFMFYTCIDDYANYTINNVILTFTTNPLISSKEIGKMLEIEGKDNFMFWNNTPEADKFYSKNNYKLKL